MTTPALDLRGLRCPLPVLRTRKALAACAPGATFVVIADDPLAAVDIPNFLRESGATLVESARMGDAVRFVVRRA